jgi:lipopolysaccharide/colanic/teichoic acid biosynthesis glycosyltransferase
VILKILHAVGLTNLSDADVDSYYETRTSRLSRPNIYAGSLTIKRCLDLYLASTMLIVLAPVLIISALAIKVTSRGPVFAAQRRIGLNGRIFSLYKFRTMVLEPTPKLAEPEQSDEATATIFTIRNHISITPFCRLLHKTGLDELPQLINVLAGDMSLVGPRPLPLYLYNEVVDEVWSRARTIVRPGMVSLWAVQGKTSVNFEEWKKLDAVYLDRWSLWLDIKIIFWSIPVALTGSSASLEWPRKRVADDTDITHTGALGVVAWR